MITLITKLPPWFNMVYTDKEGNLTPNSLLYNDEMWQSLTVLVDTFNDQFTNGLQLPQKTTAQIAALQDDLTVPVGTTWFDTDLAVVKVKTVQAIIAPPTPGVIRTVMFV